MHCVVTSICCADNGRQETADAQKERTFANMARSPIAPSQRPPMRHDDVWFTHDMGIHTH